MTLNNPPSHSSSSLRQLTISPSTWKYNMYQQIFQACPRLTHVRIIRLRNLSFQFSSNFLPRHVSLRYLNIHFYSIGNDWYNQIDWLLSIVPNVEHFTLRIDQNETNTEFSFDLLAYLLTKHLPCLTNFKAKIPLNQFLSKELNVIKRLHPLFISVEFQGYINRNLNHYLIISSE
jgi:hypothetical protein